MKIIIFITLLLLTYQQTFTDPIEQRQWHRLQEINKSKFGKQIFDQIQLELQSKAPTGEVLINILKSMQTTLREDQDQDDEDITNLSNKCVVQIEKIENRIETLKKKIVQLNQTLSEKEPILEQKEQDLEDSQNFLEKLLSQLEKIAGQKKLKDAEWKEEADQHDKATAAIMKAKKTLIEAGVQPSLIEIESDTKFAGMINTLVQVAQQAENKDNVQILFDIIEDLLDKIAESRAIEKNDYDSWLSEYNQTKTQTEKIRDQTQNKITKLTNRIKQLKQLIADLKEEIKDKEQTSQDKEKERDERQQLCRDAETGYSERRQERFDQMDIVGDAIGILSANIRLFNKFIVDRVDEIEQR